MELMILAAIAPLVARGIGEALASGDRAEAERLRQSAMAEYNIELPDIQKMEAQIQTDTELKKVMADPRYTEAENQTMGRLNDYATGSGLLPEDIATLEAAKREAAGVERGLRGRNEQAMNAKNIRNSGIDLAAQLGGSQQASNAAYMGGIQAAGDASNRRFNAMLQYGDFSNKLKQQDLQQKNQTATAQDAINRYNTADMRDVRDYNNELPQRGFDNSMKRADKRYGAKRNRADDYDNNADRAVDTAGDVGEGIQKSIRGGYKAYKG